MAKYAIVKDGKIIHEAEIVEGKSSNLFNIVTAECKSIVQKVRWGDHRCVMKRRKDPEYVIFRNDENKRRIVLVNVTEAPVDWLNQLCSLYNWVKE